MTTNTSSPGDLLERAADLRRAGRPFVLATVVRSLRPASARPGDRALLPAGGPAEGWVGGGCVQTTVEREAAKALADGQPRLLRLSPAPHAEDGILSFPMTCHSGGTLEIYLEPVLPAPELVVLGESVVAEALAALAEPLGFRLRRSLEAVSAAATGPEIALSILAEIVQRRRARSRPPESAPQPEAAPGHGVAIDPICGMQVDIASARWTAERNGQTFYFCAPGCRRAFVAAATSGVATGA